MKQSDNPKASGGNAGRLPTQPSAALVPPRDKNGKFVPVHGNSRAACRRRRLKEREALVLERVDALIADQGGESNVTEATRSLCQRLAEQQTLCDLAMLRLAKARDITREDMRTTLNAYISLAGLQLKTAAALGLKRRQRRVDLNAHIRGGS